MFIPAFSREMLRRLFGDKEPRDLRAMETAFKTVSDNDNAISTALDGDNTTANSTQQQKSDYIDFDLNAPVLEQPGRLHWNSVDQTLNIGHNNGVVQQVGQEQYVYGYNDTGSTLANGTVVAFGGVTSEGRVKFVKFVADGSVDVHQVFGVTTEEILNGQTGLATQFGLVRGLDTVQGAPFYEFWAVGDELYADAANPGRISKVKPLTPNQIVNIGYVTTRDATKGEIFVDLIKQKDKYYGEFSATTQTPSAADTAQTMFFSTTQISHGVVIEGLPPTRVKVENAGLYKFNFNVQIKSTNASSKTLHFWFAKNGTNIVDSSAYVSITANNTYVDYTNSNFFRLQANEYIQVKYATDDTNVSLTATPATSYSPSAPACLLQVTQVQQ